MKVVIGLALAATLVAACGGHGQGQQCTPDPTSMTTCYTQIPTPK
jgi:hypothetical protein